MTSVPTIIQGGMGVGISDWRLARAVSSLGQLGVVSGTALDVILVRRLQSGDPGGHMRRALDHLPFRAMADRIWQRYFVSGGKAPDQPYRALPPHAKDDRRESVLIEKALRGDARVFTDPLASPTSFPFKVAQLEGTLSESSVYAARVRVCDLGYLREAYRTDEGEIGFRCAAEPAAAYPSKGGAAEEMAGRKCICNALIANMGHPQVRGQDVEPGIVTTGDDLTGIARFLAPGRTSYSAADVLAQLL